MVASFKLITSVELDQPKLSTTSTSDTESKVQHGLKLDLYHHETGLQVLLAETSGPASLATIVVPTLCDNHLGLPHTLEHLVFCGSKHYPTRGHLEALSTRLLSTGTNAWTSSDHTAYTLSTVGHDALIHAVPVFLDHVLYPSLSDSDFLTEVYHIDGKAKQQGVVFSEMGSREYSEADLLDRTLNQIMYDNKTTYSFECGGLTENIPQLSIDMIRQYHQKFYNLKNICIILAGQDLPHLAILQNLEDSACLKCSPPTIENFNHKIEFPPCIELPETKVVLFPSDDDTCGSVGYAWRGPRFDDFSTRFALELLLFCFTDSSAAPLNQIFVAPKLPLANAISYDVRQSPETSLWIQFSGVPKGGASDGSDLEEDYELDTRGLLEPGIFRSNLLPALTATINDLSIDLISEGIKRYRVMLLESLEDNACEDLTQSLVSAIVAERFSSIPMSLSLSQIASQFTELNSLQSQTVQFWKDLAQTWLLNHAPAEVIAVPDLELGGVLESTRSAAQSERANQLGKEALDLIQTKIDSVVQGSKIVLDEQTILNLPPAPDISKLPQLPSIVTTFSQESFLAHTQMVQVDTQFTRFMIGLPTQHICEELQPYFVLFQNLLFQLDISDPDEGIIKYKEAVRLTDRLTVERFASLGLNNRNFYTNWLPELFFIGAKTEPANLEAAQDWLLRNLFFCTFTTERVLSVARNLLSELEETMRDGSELTQAVYYRLLQSGQNYDTRLETNISMFRQEEFINDVISDLLQPATASKILAQLTKLRDVLLLGLQNSVAQFSSPTGLFPDLNSPVKLFESQCNSLLKKFKPNKSNYANISNQPKIGFRAPYQFPVELTRSPCLVIPLGALTSSFVISLIPCDVFDNPEAKMAIATLCELFSRCNGPLFELIRGQGLAYHATMYLQLWSGNLVLELHDATDPSGAVRAVWEFIESLRNESTWASTVTSTEMSLAKAALAYTSTRYVDCPSAIIDGAFKYKFWGFSSTDDYVGHYRSHLEKVTLLDLRKVFLKHILDFLIPSKAQMVILTPNSDSNSDSDSEDLDNEVACDDEDEVPYSQSNSNSIIESLSSTSFGFKFQEGSLSLF